MLTHAHRRAITVDVCPTGPGRKRKRSGQPGVGRKVRASARLERLGYTATGRLYGVNAISIRKWIARDIS